MDAPNQDDGPPNNHKRVKTEHASPDDFSNSVRRKLSTSTRTGQACDRCKVRKIRCDASAGACTPCRQSSQPCKTTDRITGRATTRGYTDRVEDENRYLRQRLLECEHKLKELGVDPQSFGAHNGYVPAGPLPQSEAWTTAVHAANPAWVQDQATAVTLLQHHVQSSSGAESAGPQVQITNVFERFPLPSFRTGCIGDNYLGVSLGGSLLSPIKGMHLTFFGADIDVGEFVPDQADDATSPVSYKRFLDLALNRIPNIREPPLPATQAECEQYATWYFRSINPYAPVLHKPSIMELISRVYSNSQPRPPVVELVHLHMMLAHLKHQISLRNWNDAELEESHAHLRFAVSRWYELITGHTIADVQALTLISIHLRNFPRPGAAWITSHVAFGLAIEIGLHRSLNVWKEGNDTRDQHEIEMRKRVFWTLHGLHGGLCGKLGRPIPLRAQDIDIEFPEPVNDNLPTETNITEFRKCSFNVGIYTCKIMALFPEMYSTIYSIKLPHQAYEGTVRRLEEELRQWRESIPPEISDPSLALQEDRVFALYLKYWDLEFQLLLHHPALCRSTDPQEIARNESKCLEAGAKMLDVVSQLRDWKSLDMPWIAITVYLAAIFTTLFVQNRRAEQITPSDMAKLRADMELWLDILGDIGITLRSGSKLRDKIGAIVRNALVTIGGNLTKQTASAALSHPSAQAMDQLPSQTSEQYGSMGAYSSPLTEPHHRSNSVAAQSQPSYLPPDDPSVAQARTPYPATMQYPYPPERAAAPAPPYTPPTNNAFEAGAYPVSSSYGPVPADNLAASEWARWTQATFPHMGMQGYNDPAANALLTLGGRSTAEGGQPQWPQLIYQNGGPAHGP